tara:strand:- start:288 stop:494 length:207 start_codon:yes stop_codon:yes gene_type:complete
MKKRKISVESLEKRCKEFVDTQQQVRETEQLPPLSNSERLHLMAMLAESLEQSHEVIEEDTKGDKNGV